MMLVALAAAAAAAGPGAEARDVAAAIAARGPRPAASAAELAAQRRVAIRFRAAGLRVAYQPFRVPGRGRSRNVIGIREGPGRCLRIVMAHADTVAGTPGAEDNASGLGALAELAGRLPRLAPPCDVWLVATGAEERILTGSPDHLGALALARRVARTGLGGRLRYALSLDEVGTRGAFVLRSPVPRPRAALETPVLRTAADVGVAVRWTRDTGTGNSDHREFELLGLPAAKLGVAANPCRHLPCDRSARLRAVALGRVVRLVTALVRGP